MKNLIVSLLMLSLVSFGCVQNTSYGECEGLATEDAKKPNLVYRLDAWNIIMAIIFSETLVIPVYVVGWDLWCPSGFKTADAVKL